MMKKEKLTGFLTKWVGTKFERNRGRGGLALKIQPI